VFGDPALLLPMLRPDLVELSQQPRRGVTFVSHMDDPPQSALPGIEMMSPRDDVETILRALVKSELVIATSLHPVIVAEAFGVPARSIVNQSEPEFKFADYYLSTGRPDYTRATSVVEALTGRGESRPEVDLEPLFNSFPIDLFIDEETSSHG
jgi:pyruvyltransferase